MRSVHFFNLYFESFKNILLSNLLYFVPVLIAAAYVYATYIIFDGINVIAASAAFIILNTFMSGVTLVSRYIYTEKEFSVVKAYFKGVKENWKRFFVHGVLFYIVFVISYMSITSYYSGTKTSSFFWVPLVIAVLIALVMLFISYYANIMTVTIDIDLKSIYKNCFLFSFGELKNNILVTVALLIFAAVIFTILVIFFNPILLVILGSLLTALIIPSTIQYIITFYVYDDMVAMLDSSVKKEKQEQKTAPAKPAVDREEAEEISHLVPETDNSNKDEYIFHNGRMIKRSAVESQLNNEYDD